MLAQFSSDCVLNQRPPISDRDTPEVKPVSESGFRRKRSKEEEEEEEEEEEHVPITATASV